MRRWEELGLRSGGSGEPRAVFGGSVRQDQSCTLRSQCGEGGWGRKPRERSTHVPAQSLQLSKQVEMEGREESRGVGASRLTRRNGDVHGTVLRAAQRAPLSCQA